MTDLTKIIEALAKQATGGQQQSQQGGLGGILGSVLGGLGGTQQQVPQSKSSGFNASSLLIAVVPLVLGWIQQNGGLQGALAKLQGAGLGGQAQSWVDPNQGNTEASTDQIQSLFDEKDVEQVAQQAQVPKQDVYSAISSVLPKIIDSLTPQGNSTDHKEANSDIQNVMNMVSGFLKK